MKIGQWLAKRRYNYFDAFTWAGAVVIILNVPGLYWLFALPELLIGSMISVSLERIYGK